MERAFIWLCIPFSDDDRGVHFESIHHIKQKERRMNMKYFTKFLCLFLGAAMMLTMAACGSKGGTDANAGADGEKKQLVVATSPDFPPFEFLDGSQIVGIEPALMQAIADKLGMELVWEQVDFDSIIPGIQAERYDVGAAGITITPDRQKNCDFSNPYFLANQVIVVNPGSDIQGKADLAGKTIAVQTGTTAEEYCMDNGYSVLSFASNNDAQAALTSGKADAWVVDNEAAARMAADQSLTVLDEAMTSEPYAFAFAKGSSLVDQVNTALQELLQDGTVEKLFQEYDTVYVSPLS